MASNPKLAQASVAMVCVVMMQLAFVVSALSERFSATPHFERFLGSTLLLSVPWVLVLVVDLTAFPTMKMTRLILGSALRVAVFASAYGVLALAFDLLGDSTRFSLLGFVAELVATFIGIWGVVGLALLVRERFRLSGDVDGSYRESVSGVHAESS